MWTIRKDVAETHLSRLSSNSVADETFAVNFSMLLRADDVTASLGDSAAALAAAWGAALVLTS